MAQQTDHIGDTNKMVTMKLYTEEQVKEMLSMTDMIFENDLMPHVDIISCFKPIELPSDEEAGVIALNIASTLKDSLESREEAFYLAGFQTCAKWIRDKILKQNK